MTKFAVVALALAGLFAAACTQQPSEPAGARKPAAEEKPVVNTPPVADPAFDRAVNFDCGGKKVDVLFENGSIRVRVDGGAAATRAAEPAATSGLTFADKTTRVTYDGMDGLSYVAGGATLTCKFVPRELPAPKPEGVVRTLTLQDAGKTAEIRKGEKIAVALVGVPTAGYVWGADKVPAWVKASEGPGGATSSAQMLPGFAGGNHWEVVILEAVGTGEGDVTLAQRRPWEKNEPAAETFKFRLKAS